MTSKDQQLVESAKQRSDGLWYSIHERAFFGLVLGKHEQYLAYRLQ